MLFRFHPALAILAATILCGGCTTHCPNLETFGRLEGEAMGRAYKPATIAHNNAIHLTAFDRYKNGGDYTAVVIGGTVEGGTVSRKLVIRQRRATVIEDFRRDSYAGGVGVVEDELKELRLGWFKG